ncbi:ATP-dependent RNA helicase DDX25, partial [Paragonimus heterotremus]
VSTDEEEFVTDQIVIGTPGTIANWLRCLGPIRLDASFLKTFVLDEADVMILEEGFFNISLRIKKRLPSTCQILLFSATFDDEVVEFAREFVPDPIEIRVKRTQLPLKNIKQFHLRFSDWTDKYQALTDIYGGFDVGQAIIFCATRKEASWLEGRLNGDGHRVAILSGELDVKEREAPLEYFRFLMNTSFTDRMCVISPHKKFSHFGGMPTSVTDIGLDIPQVNLIINWNMPLICSGSADCETYLHRIGRSGRFGKNGVAVNFTIDEELDVLRELEDYFDIKIPALTTEDLLDM